MAFSGKFTSTSGIFDKTKRQQGLSNLVSRNARNFRQDTKNKMIRGSKSGRLYSKKRGAGFTRSHRASARGERPAPDTQTLVNAISSRSLSDTSAEVYIAERINPETGTPASRYAEYLNDPEVLDRPIMSEADTAEAQTKMTRESGIFIDSLV